MSDHVLGDGNSGNFICQNLCFEIVDSDNQKTGFSFCQARPFATSIEMSAPENDPDVCSLNNGDFDIIIGPSIFSPVARKISKLGLGPKVEGKKIWIKTHLFIDIEFKNCEIKVSPGKGVIVTSGVFFKTTKSKFAS